MTTDQVIRKQGKLLLIGDAHCTKKITGTLRKHRSKKECVVFIFKQSVVICEKVSSDQEFSEAQIDYWTSFHVSFIRWINPIAHYLVKFIGTFRRIWLAVKL